MKSSRREFVLAAGAALLAGCAGEKPIIGVPGPVARRPIYPTYTPPLVRSTPYGNPAPAPAPAPMTAPPANAPPAGSLRIIPRQSWAGGTPIIPRLNPMGGINRITVHHEGCRDAVLFDDVRSAAARLESIRVDHTRGGHNWGDIGYHFVVDRAGRIWEARPLQYQGAHVKDNNENNLGIMLLGNFDLQSPSSAQVATLRQAIIGFRRQYGVPVGRVLTHQEINPTRCPGIYLQNQMAGMRSGGYLA